MFRMTSEQCRMISEQCRMTSEMKQLRAWVANSRQQRGIFTSYSQCQVVRNHSCSKYILIEKRIMKTKITFLGLILLLELIGCRNENEFRNVNTFSIVYSQSSSWVDYYYKVKIEKDGMMQINEHQGLSSLNRQSNYNISENDIALIKEKLANLSTMNIDDKYGFGEDKPTDLPVTLIRYETDFNSDSTAIYFPDKAELPKELESFLSTIDQIISDTDTLKNE